MAQTYTNYVSGKPDGYATAAASLCGKGIHTLGAQLNTVDSNGVTRNIIDDGSGNAVITGTLSVGGASFPLTTSVSLLSGNTNFATTPTNFCQLTLPAGIYMLSSGLYAQNTPTSNTTMIESWIGPSSGTIIGAYVEADCAIPASTNVFTFASASISSFGVTLPAGTIYLQGQASQIAAGAAISLRNGFAGAPATYLQAMRIG